MHPLGDGPVTLLGQFDGSATPGARVSRAANGGWTVGNFLQRDFTFDQQLPALKPDLLLVWLGQNDQLTETPTQFGTNLNLLIDRLKADTPEAEIVLVGTYDSGSSLLGPLVDTMAQVAAARDVGFLNFHDTAGDYQFFLDHNYLLPDGIHFSAAGGQYMGNLLFNAFETDGASLAPEPGSLGLLALGAIGLLARRR